MHTLGNIYAVLVQVHEIEIAVINLKTHYFDISRHFHSRCPCTLCKRPGDMTITPNTTSIFDGTILIQSDNKSMPG